jgi:hypothetical protein
MKPLHYDDVLRIMKNNEPHPFNKKVMDNIFHVMKSYYRAFLSKSKIDPNTPIGKEILNYQGMSGTKTRHLYNNLLEIENAKYLEIGTWYGSSSISAVYKNKVDALFIDNWSQFDGDRTIFQNAIEKYLTKDSQCQLLESDCWKVNLNKIPKNFNIYLYDGGHTEEDHYQALNYYYDNLDDVFIFLVDDWCWLDVRQGTWRAIREKKLKVRFIQETFLSQEELYNFPSHQGKETWWNGIGIFVLEKSS